MIKNLFGQKFGRLTVVGAAGVDKGRHAMWKCACECGKETIVAGYNLRSGHIRSCGCLLIETRKRIKTKHGYAPNGKKPTEYSIWCSMIKRRENPNCKAYPNYGGRGIKVCESWRNDFLAFLNDVGHRPSYDLSLDRIDNDGDYEPGNVRWATRKEQANNKRKQEYGRID